MNREQQFHDRIAQIHGFGPAGGKPMDVRLAELQAMADVFLGENFDQRKLQRIREVQAALHTKQAELVKQLDAHKISPQSYYSALSTVVAETFQRCEAILGPDDFRKLFGEAAPLNGLAGQDSFLKAYSGSPAVR